MDEDQAASQKIYCEGENDVEVISLSRKSFPIGVKNQYMQDFQEDFIW